jgi:hypothetical protein
MGKKVLLVVRACLILAVTAVTGSFVDPAQAKDPRVEFELTDEPGSAASPIRYIHAPA